MKFAFVRRRIVAVAAASFVALLFAACNMNAPGALSGALSKAVAPTASTVPSLGAAAAFAVLAGTTVTNAGPSVITGDVGVSPGTALTGFDPSNTIVIDPAGGTVTGTAGMGIVNGTIYAGGTGTTPAAQAHADAATAYAALIALAPNVTFAPVFELSTVHLATSPIGTLTPGVYRFASSANLQAGGTLTLDFQGNANAVFVFQIASTLVTKLDSKIVAINNPNASNDPSCLGANVYWAVGSSATIDGAQFLGTVIAVTTITMTSAANTPPATNVDGRMLAINGAVTMSNDTISTCGTSGGGTVPPPPVKCPDFVTGGGWIDGNSDATGHHKRDNRDKATFGVSGGFKNGQFWGQLSYNDHGKNGIKVKSTSVTAYMFVDPTTRRIEGTARINGGATVTYVVIVSDKGERGRNDTFSIELSNGYSASGSLLGGNIQLHNDCGKLDNHHDNRWGKDRNDNHFDQDEQDGNNNCDR